MASFAAYFVFQALLTGDSLRSSIGDPGVVRALIGGGLYLAILGLLGLGLGAIIRSSAGAIAALFTLLFVPQILVELLPSSWKTTAGRYVPMEAGSQIFSQRHEAGALGPWTGLGVFSLYAAVAVIAGLRTHQPTGRLDLAPLALARINDASTKGQGDEMSISLTCKHCKIDISADDEDELVTRVQAHVRTDEHITHLPAHARAHDRRSELTREHILTRLHRRSPE